MWKVLPVALSVLVVVPAFGLETHKATPLEELLKRFHQKHPHGHTPATPSVGALPPAEPYAAKVFDLTARQFEFVISPQPFVVNAGDTVTFNITVPATDGSPTGHGFLLEHYAEDAIIVARGRSITITFTATTPGTFTYLCTNATCDPQSSGGHTRMNGLFTVLAAVPEPNVASITPSSGPASGGTAVTINGSNFTSGATVKFGAIAATSVTVNGNTSITAVAPPSGPGKVTITVTNPDGKTSVFDGYTYTGPAPPRRRTARS